MRIPLPSAEKLSYFKLVIETLILLMLIVGVFTVAMKNPSKATERLLKAKDL